MIEKKDDDDDDEEEEDANVAVVVNHLEQHQTVPSRWREQVPKMKLQPENKVFHCISLYDSLRLSPKKCLFLKFSLL